MQNVVEFLAAGYEALTAAVVWTARLAQWLLLAAAAAASAAMVADVAVTRPARIARADTPAQPSDSIVLIGQLMGSAALLGGLVLVSRDGVAWWQSMLVIVGGAALLVAMTGFGRAGAERRRRLAWLAWMMLAAAAVSASVVAFVQRRDSSIPYTVLLVAALLIARAWFGLARPELRFKPGSRPDAADDRGGALRAAGTAVSKAGSGAGAALARVRRGGRDRAADAYDSAASGGTRTHGALSARARDRAADPADGATPAGTHDALSARARDGAAASADGPAAEGTRTHGALSARGLGMTYELPDGDHVRALADVSFDLEPGRLLTLLGPSGCGKTTLLNIIAGFLAPTSGELTLGGVRVAGPGQDRGVVFQSGALFEWLSVSDNVGFGARMNGRSRPQSRRDVQGLLSAVGLDGFGDKAVYELSGGMQQRVALARCLANDPEIVIMDEPLGALDALTREKMQGLVLDLWHDTGKTIVLVTHSVEEALYLGDRLFVMAPRPGRIERSYELPFAGQARGADPRELKASSEFIEAREEILSIIWHMEEQIMSARSDE